MPLNPVNDKIKKNVDKRINVPIFRRSNKIANFFAFSYNS